MNILNRYSRYITEQAPNVKTGDVEKASDSKSELVASCKTPKMIKKEHLIFYSLPFSHFVANTTLPLTVQGALCGHEDDNCSWQWTEAWWKTAQTEKRLEKLWHKSWEEKVRNILFFCKKKAQTRSFPPHTWNRRERGRWVKTGVWCVLWVEVGAPPSDMF